MIGSASCGLAVLAAWLASKVHGFVV